MDSHAIISEILDLMHRHGGPGYAWYVGTGRDAAEKLFSDHGVSVERGIWIWKRAGDPAIAREVEDYFVANFISDGALGGGDVSSTQVYAYKKTGATNP